MNTLFYFKVYNFIFFHKLLNIFLTILGLIYFDLGQAYKAPRLLVISFGGFRSDYLSQNLTPVLFELSKSGVVGSNMKSTFATFGLPNLYSISTGLYQETHGIVHDEMFDPVLNETFIIKSVEERWWFNEYTFPIWMINELYEDNNPRYSGLLMWPGATSKNHNYICTYNLPYSRKYNLKQKMDIILEWFNINIEPANLILAYFDEPDSTAHNFGPFSPQVIGMLKKLDDSVAYLLQKLKANKLLSNSNLIFISDHGMALSKSNHVIELNKYLSKDSYRMFGSSTTWNLFPNKNNEEEIYEILKNISTKLNNFKVYKKNEIPEEYHYQNNRRIAPLLIVAEEGWTITDEIKDGSESKSENRGEHGYNNSLPSMRPLFMALGPYFQKNLTFKTEFVNIDIFPLMCLLLGLYPLQNFPSNGSLYRISDILASHLFPSHTISWVPFVITFCPIILVVLLAFAYFLYRVFIIKDVFRKS